MDGAVTLSLHELATSHAWLAEAARLVANYGAFLLPLALVGVWFVVAREDARRAVLAGCIAAVLAICLGLVLEHTLGRTRPFVALGVEPLVPHAADSSFPSDHTLIGVALVGALAFRVPRIGVWLLVWALLVGVARVIAALHYPTDILGSAVLALVLDGLAWLASGRLLALTPQALRERLGLGRLPRPERA